MLAAEEYTRLTGKKVDFRLSGPDLSELDLPRDVELRS
jgi:hypothetical protein